MKNDVLNTVTKNVIPSTAIKLNKKSVIQLAKKLRPTPKTTQENFKLDIYQ